MGDFAAEMERRLGLASEAIGQANAAGDDHGVATHEAELEELLRVADRHGLRVRRPSLSAACDAADQPGEEKG
ncbi:hypothetical protein [Actinoallomurus sp. NPDC050550]|uniref:hypothetical protein n=1 Tax=Actinoallomurus sp. NPDC050550 TaxID=3154937 RepID=UPI00340333D7